MPISQCLGAWLRPGPTAAPDPHKAHLRGHAADSGQVIACTHKVGGIELQLEGGEPLADGLCTLEDTRHPLQARRPVPLPRGATSTLLGCRPARLAVRCPCSMVLPPPPPAPSALISTTRVQLAPITGLPDRPPCLLQGRPVRGETLAPHRGPARLLHSVSALPAHRHAHTLSQDSSCPAHRPLPRLCPCTLATHLGHLRSTARSTHGIDNADTYVHTHHTTPHYTTRPTHRGRGLALSWPRLRCPCPQPAQACTLPSDAGSSFLGNCSA